MKLRENCNNLCKEVGIVRSKPARWTIFARRERHREGFEKCEGLSEEQGCTLAQDAQNKKGRGEFRTREESEPKSREGGARTKEFGNLGGVGTRSCRVRTREVVAAACTSGSAALTGSWETGGRRSPGPPTRSRYLICFDYLVSSPPRTWSSPWSGALRQPGQKNKVGSETVSLTLTLTQKYTNLC